MGNRGAKPPKPATYADIEALPAHLIGEILDGARWLLMGTWSGTDKVRAEPFDALELDLSLLWPA